MLGGNLGSLFGDSNTHPQHMILWRNIEKFTFYYFYSDPRFPPFYHMLGGNLGSLLYGDVSVMHEIWYVASGTPATHSLFK